MDDLCCRFCGTLLRHTFVDLGMSPLANGFRTEEQLSRPETYYPLRAFVCGNCFLVQLEEFESPRRIFSDYAYFSSYSQGWLDHARSYVNMMIDRFSLGSDTKVVEIASNDGYLLQYFKEKGVDIFGIEPAANTAEVALRKGIPTEVDFFGRSLAERMITRGSSADLLLGNNVLAHVPDINDFVAGLKILLRPGGIITMEFPHLLELIRLSQFDTIYHEHFSYFSLSTVMNIFSHHGLRVFDVERLSTHGGSLRIFSCHDDNDALPVASSVGELMGLEEREGLRRIETYRKFGDKVRQVKRSLLSFLIEAKEQGKSIAAYGAAAKGNTLLNYCGIRDDFIDFVVDRNPHKQGKYLPGTHIPVCGPEKITVARPDYLLVLPWNLRDEIISQMAGIREWGGCFVMPIPVLEIVK